MENKKELKKLMKGQDIVKYMKVQRKNVGNISTEWKIQNQFKKIIDWNPIGIRTKGRQKNSWRYEVINYLKQRELRNWIQLVKDRRAWNDVVQNTKNRYRACRVRTRRRYVYIYIYIHRVSQEECEILRESVPYVKLYRYNPKHLYPKLNGY